MSEAENQTNPAFKVVAGNPTAEELAVVVTVLQAAAAQATDSAGKLRKLTSTWHLNAGVLRSQITPGPGQWRASVRHGLR